MMRCSDARVFGSSVLKNVSRSMIRLVSEVLSTPPSGIASPVDGPGWSSMKRFATPDRPTVRIVAVVPRAQRIALAVVDLEPQLARPSCGEREGRDLADPRPRDLDEAALDHLPGVGEAGVDR